MGYLIRQRKLLHHLAIRPGLFYVINCGYQSEKHKQMYSATSVRRRLLYRSSRQKSLKRKLSSALCPPFFDKFRFNIYRATTKNAFIMQNSTHRFNPSLDASLLWTTLLFNPSASAFSTTGTSGTASSGVPIFCKHFSVYTKALPATLKLELEVSAVRMVRSSPSFRLWWIAASIAWGLRARVRWTNVSRTRYEKKSCFVHSLC